ncbi:hypothetical protein LCGC14_1138850 [marine sediment metagenome]|uniref:Uncharacterized protein n=1 Tax=marine sediment metagenome TaxID=412755 RepID=A0A0F9LYZ2_9ZZZZ
MSVFGKWIQTSATGTTTAAIDLGRSYDFLNIFIPDVTHTANFSLKVADASGGSYYNLGDSSSLKTFAVTGNYFTTFDLGGYQFIKVILSSNEASGTKTFETRGWSR